MSLIENMTQYPAVDPYWSLVTRTLCDVFKGQPDAAETLRREVSTRPTDEQWLFYHSEPLDVAADLVAEQPDDNQVKEYCRLADQCGWR